MKIEEAIKQQTGFKDEYQKLVVNLLYTASWLNGIQSRFFKEFGLTVQQYNILRILKGQKGGSLSIQSITNRMIDKMSNSSRIVDRLKNKGLVDRVSCPEDRRQVEVSITPKGEKLLEEVGKKMDIFHGATHEISVEEAQTINNLLDKLRTKEEVH